MEAWIYGDMTKEAVMAFQASMKLSETGVI